MNFQCPKAEWRASTLVIRHSSVVIRPSSFQRSGFTLLEILVVLGLLMMLFGVSIISISGIKEEDRLRRAVAMIET
ncbi:MAG: hypothetical protein ACK5TH_24495, partial [Prosthecobacter sp.]